MEITTEILQEKFEEYNNLYFNGELPLPRFGLLKSYMTCGYFSCKKIIGKRKLRGQRIDISCYYDWEEEGLRDILVHEMIHYYLAYKHIDNELTHGDAFINMANNFNEIYGMNIGKKANAGNFKKLKNAPRFSWFLTQIFG